MFIQLQEALFAPSLPIILSTGRDPQSHIWVWGIPYLLHPDISKEVGCEKRILQ